MTVRRLAARDLEQSGRTNLERLEPLLFRTQLQQDMSEHTPFLRLRAQLQQDVRAINSELNYTGCYHSHPKTKIN